MTPKQMITRYRPDKSHKKTQKSAHKISEALKFHQTELSIFMRYIKPWRGNTQALRHFKASAIYVYSQT